MPDNDSLIQNGALVVNLCSGEALLNGQPVSLTTTESRLLCFLTSHPGCSFTRRQIIDAVQGKDYPTTDRSVDVQVNGLRKKLGGAGSLIETVRGAGYVFRE
ncbi:MAG: winged helix-turn-helix domain-containing protein [Thermoguttaceae bacterium]